MRACMDDVQDSNSKEIVDADHVAVGYLVFLVVVQASRNVFHNETGAAQDDVQNVEPMIYMVLQFINRTRDEYVMIDNTADVIDVNTTATIRRHER